MHRDSSAAAEPGVERRGWPVAILTGLLMVWGQAAGSEASAPTVTALFDVAEPLEIRLEGPYYSIRGDTEEDVPFTLVVEGKRIEVDLRVRGRSRRDNCRHPPLWIRFREDAAGTPLAGLERVKLVTHCDNGDKYQTNTLEEHVAYRLLEPITPARFRTRLLDVTYVDGDRELRRYGFLIEPRAWVIGRMEGERDERNRVERTDLDPLHTTRLALFQYLIANTDFSFVAGPEDERCCHNGMLVRDAEGLKFVAYDFDNAGLVDPPYALPAKRFPIKSVRQRYYRGFCTTPELLDEALAPFIEHRETFAAIVEATPGLDDRDRRRINRFLDGFYRRIDRSGSEVFMKSCREGPILGAEADGSHAAAADPAG